MLAEFLIALARFILHDEQAACMEASCAAVAFVKDLVVKDIAIFHFIVLFGNTFDNYSLIKLLSWPAVQNSLRICRFEQHLNL
jgi:hypothetical protein